MRQLFAVVLSFSVVLAVSAQAATDVSVKEKNATTKASAQISKPIVDDKKPAAKQAAKTVAKTTPPIVEIKKGAKTVTKTVTTQSAVASAPLLNYVGEIETYKARGDDTLLTIGERNSLGYVELRSANPAMDPWRPGAGTFMILPKMHLLPDAPRKGIVINLSEMRVYYYQRDGQVKTFPIGVGREGFSTPIGSTTVVSKTKDPTWRPTDRMLREDPTLKPFYGPGPDNPLGHFALYLGWPQYRMHGTNKPWGIGRRVSSGCIRMYDQDVEYLFQNVPVGTPVTTVLQPIKFAWIGNMLYIEAHPDEMLADQVERVGGAPLDYKVPAALFGNLQRAAGKASEDINWQAVRQALRERRGYPVPILNGATDANMFVSASVIQRAGTSRSDSGMSNQPMDETVQTPVAAPAPADDVQQPAVRRRSGSFNG